MMRINMLDSHAEPTAMREKYLLGLPNNKGFVVVILIPMKYQQISVYHLKKVVKFFCKN